MKMNKLLALMLVLALALSTCIFAYAENASAIPEIPAELIPEIPAAHVEEPTVPSAEPVQAPTIPAVLPAVETSQEFVPTLSSNYAYISGGTRLYQTAAKDKLLGAFTGMNTVRVIWQKDYYNEAGDIEYSLYQAVFYAGGERVEGYFYASALGFITLKDEAELLDGSDELKILTAEFEFAEEEAPAADYPCINTNAVNLRKGPAKSEPKVDKLAEGTHVDVIESVTNDAGEVWLKVTAGGKTGYVLASLVDGYSAPKAEEPEADSLEPIDESEHSAFDFKAAVEQVRIRIEAASHTLIYGDTVKLIAEVPTELEGAQMQWLESNAQGGWDEIPGATGSSVAVTLTPENAEASWCVRFTQE